MSEFSLNDVGLKVGLEIHQQLATDKKLFCSCAPIESTEYPVKFHRILRASRSELGEYDPAALFEKSKSNTITYYGNPQSSCLVEHDEEPPHDIDAHAKEITLIIASALHSNIFSEIYPMRKTVVDGSNTSGFQRTILVAQGGYYNSGERRIKIQSICLEEDAARILGDEGMTRKYSLDRLGIPLVEIATEPFEANPKEIKEIALSLGRILRSTKKVRRGIGSIRQDVNVSIMNSGIVVEVKGVQQLDQLEKVVEFEAKRQYGLVQISAELNKINLERPENIDVTKDAHLWDSKIIKSAVEKKHKIILMIFKDMAGLFGKEYTTGIRLGRDVAELVRFFGLGGIFHSDELPAYGITQENIDNLKKTYSIKSNDAFLMLAVQQSISDVITKQIFLRIKDIQSNKIPRDTRLATQAGETKFLRPRPGAARMYPETDIAPITISKVELENASKKIPKSWDESVAELETKFKLNGQLAEQIFDSHYMELFEKIAGNTSVSPVFVASTLCSSITSLARDGLDSSLLKYDEILRTFELLDEKKIAKESVGIIFEDIMAGRSKTAKEAVRNASIEAVSESDLEKIIKEIVEKNMDIINKQKERAVGPLMGMVMKELRGSAPGETVSKILTVEIKKRLEG